ncbi:MAG: sensor histidine kinase [Thermodesulfobacteriota bacterium]
MRNISENEIIEELKRRFLEKDKALYDLKIMTKKLEKVNKSLLESERLKSDFLSNLKNEINNPLTVLIDLSSKLVDLDIDDRDKYKTVANMLHSEALNLDFQIRNILTAAELEEGDASLHITKVDVNSLLDNCLKNFNPVIEEKGIRIIKEENLSPLWLNSDSDKLYMVMFNLVGNGIIFNKEGGSLHISMEISNNEFFFSVRDEGIGIKKSDLTIIFDRFKQLDMGMQKRYRGHGLGLSVAKAAANLLGGNIMVESKPGMGSTFTLKIPLHTDMEVEDISVGGAEYFLEEGQEF